ncbi:4Fe-4S dicluster domain-containing protein [Natroniella sulfidigena]|uniref:4Fe-4S dicluster domain-containing protein n=1 Tax=Natroniella sulfidigena TaxID=723921 RepID=UPI00200B5C98|nr:4Fe-4S dicluster domain-containing protein [Natroniella sulfidigena]MCK8815957.1 4Fe-4S dicluster domain-containing protein [Natroniella sulfidigena]
MPKSILIDVSKCHGCRGCQVACKNWNDLEATLTQFEGSYENPTRLSAQTWTRVRFIEQTDGGLRFLFRKDTCKHCTDASCMAVCPANAIYRKDKTGAVIINRDECIGCKNCVTACPYQIPQYSKTAGTVAKCHLCNEGDRDRIGNGLQPACVSSCPTGALIFGDRAELLNDAKARVNHLARQGTEAYVYGEKELSGLNVFYILDEPSETYGLPAKPTFTDNDVFWLAKWANILFGTGLLTAIPYYLFFNSEEEPQDLEADDEESNSSEKEVS